MISSMLKSTLLKSGAAAAALLLAGGIAQADVNVTLTASPAAAALPDGQSVPMWGLLCGTVSNGTFTYSAGADTNNGAALPCTTMNGLAQTGSWQPPLITVPQGSALNITLIDNLSFANANTVPTSLVIVGQLGGGLGNDRQTMPSPVHAPQGTTWPGTLGGTDTNAGDAVFTPPAQLDRVRSMASEVNVSDTGGKVLTWSSLRPGTYLIESGTEPSIQGPMGLYGVLVVTETGANTAYGTTFDASVPLLLSEIDPAQNREVAQVVQNAGFSDQTVWSGRPGGCGDVAQPATAHTCYPPAVNYTPMYYLVNGLAFDRTNAAASTLAVPAAGTQTRVLLRLVNAGLHMHVPSVVGAQMTLLAEDGNKLPGNARVQNEVFLAAGKTYDVTIQPAQSTTPGTYAAATYAVFDRALGLSTSNQRDGGMQAYLQVAGGALPAAGTTLNAANKSYNCIAGSTLAISDPTQGLLAGAVGANGVTLGPTLTGDVSATTLTMNSDGTFTYVPTPGPTCGGSFSYLVNGSLARTATITRARWAPPRSAKSNKQRGRPAPQCAAPWWRWSRCCADCPRTCRSSRRW